MRVTAQRVNRVVGTCKVSLGNGAVNLRVTNLVKQNRLSTLTAAKLWHEMMTRLRDVGGNETPA